MKERLWKFLRRIALPGVFTSLAVTGLLIAFDMTSDFADILRQFFISVLYSLCIGVILATIMPAIWRLSESGTQPLRWASRIGAIATGTGLGALLSGVCLLFVFRGSPLLARIARSSALPFQHAQLSRVAHS